VSPSPACPAGCGSLIAKTPTSVVLDEIGRRVGDGGKLVLAHFPWPARRVAYGADVASVSIAACDVETLRALLPHLAGVQVEQVSRSGRSVPGSRRGRPPRRRDAPIAEPCRWGCTPATSGGRWTPPPAAARWSSAWSSGGSAACLRSAGSRRFAEQVDGLASHDVLERGHMREEIEVLESHRDGADDERLQPALGLRLVHHPVRSPRFDGQGWWLGSGYLPGILMVVVFVVRGPW